MDKSVLESFKSALETAGVTEFSIRFEGGNRVASHCKDSKLFILNDYVLAIEPKNNHGAKPKAVYNATAVPFDNIDDAKSYDLTSKEIIDLLDALGIDINDEEVKEFITKHGSRVSIGTRTSGGYYGEIHNEKGQIAFTTPLAARITTAEVDIEEGVSETDPESPIK